MIGIMEIIAVTNANTTFELQSIDRLGNPVSLVGMTFRASFKPAGGGAVAFSISTASGDIADAGFADGFIKITIPKAAAAAGAYVFDMLSTADGIDSLFSRGTLTILQGITV